MIRPRSSCRRTRSSAREDIAGQWCHITALDRCLGRMLDALEEARIAEDTIVVFTSDHGDMLGAHDLDRKQKPWDESIMVPWVMQWPGGISRGRRRDTLLNAPDIMPTLLTLMGVETPETVEGQDLSGAVLGTGGLEPTSAYIANPMSFPGDRHDGVEWRGVRTKTHTYVERLDGPWLLYDNARDPWQMANLVGDPAQADVQEELAAELASWMERTGDDGAPKGVWAERLGYTINERGIIGYVGKVGLHDPDNERDGA